MYWFLSEKEREHKSGNKIGWSIVNLKCTLLTVILVATTFCGTEVTPEFLPLHHSHAKANIQSLNKIDCPFIAFHSKPYIRNQDLK